MKKHHTKNKGDFGVLQAQVSLAKQGWLPLAPATEHGDFDLVAYKDGKFKRIQVKYRSMNKGAISVRFSSVWSDRNGVHSVPVNKDEIDLYCIYCPELDECYWFDPKEFNRFVTLRIKRPKNGQTSNINFASDYVTIPA